MIFNPDVPISASEPTDDLLGRSSFCSRIAAEICIPAGKPCLVLSIEGPWGFGKTSAINLIARDLAELEEEERPIIVHFNPWMIGSVEALAQEFFLQVASAIGLSPHATKAAELAQSLSAYSSLFSVVKWVPGAEPWASLFAKSLEIAGKGTQAVADLSTLNIAQQKRRVTKSIVRLGKPFVVFIDDLDRLPPKEVFSVIRLVKAVSDFPQVAYVLAFDPGYVEAALEGAGVRGGRAYLDKIVQVRLPLPPINLTQIGKLVDREVGALAAGKDFREATADKDRLPLFYHRYMKFLLRTPRDVYRVFNRVRLLYPAIKKDILLADFIALETIAITAPPLYDHIRERPQAYVGPLELEIFQEPQEVVAKLEEERQRAIDACPAGLRKILSDLVFVLFPLTVGGPYKGNRGPHRTSRLVGNSTNLIIALSGGVPPNEMSLSRVRAFIETPERRNDIAAEEAGKGRLEDFLDVLQNLLKMEPAKDPLELAEALSFIEELAVVKELNKGRSFLKAEVATQVFWVLRTILESQPKEDARRLIGKIVKRSDMLALSVGLLRLLRWQHGIPNGETEQPEASRFFTKEELDELTALWIRSTGMAFLAGVGWASNEAGPALYLLASIDSSVARQTVRSGLDAGADAQDNVALAIGSGDWDSDRGDYACLTEEKLERFIDVETMRKVASQRLAEGVSGAALRAIYTSVLKGTKEYFCDH